VDSTDAELYERKKGRKEVRAWRREEGDRERGGGREGRERLEKVRGGGERWEGKEVGGRKEERGGGRGGEERDEERGGGGGGGGGGREGRPRERGGGWEEERGGEVEEIS
jgi:hypothetical protein